VRSAIQQSRRNALVRRYQKLLDKEDASEFGLADTPGSALKFTQGGAAHDRARGA
jgi:hypothetical protein